METRSTVAAVFPIGQTAGGCIAAINDILARESSLEVYLVHGILEPDQNPPNPADVALEISQSFDARVRFASLRPMPTFEISASYPVAREVLRGINEQRYVRVYIGITGGANPLVASLFHAALAYLDTEVIPVYAQGKGPETQRVFFADDLRLEVLEEKAFSYARSGQTRVAAALTASFPDRLPWKFVREALRAIACWDDFDYKTAQGILRGSQRHVHAVENAPVRAPLAETVSRLAQVAPRLTEFVRVAANPGDFARSALPRDWMREAGILLVADTLHNAERRLHEGRFTDCVLRSYRSAECATQVRLMLLGVHPSKPAAAPEVLSCLRLPEKFDRGIPLGFWTGLNLLYCNDASVTDPADRNLKHLQDIRNRTFLEHGYQRVTREQAQQCLNYARTICRSLLTSAALDPCLSTKLEF